MPAASRRARSALRGGPALLLLAACHSPPADPVAAAPEADRIDCRTGGATGFARDCAVERTIGPDGTVLTIRRRDGGFRRLLVGRDGRDITAADGAVPATVRAEGDAGILVSVAGDSYRLPARMRQAGAR